MNKAQNDSIIIVDILMSMRGQKIFFMQPETRERTRRISERVVKKKRNEERKKKNRDRERERSFRKEASGFLATNARFAI